ncbi:MAG: c-type cytochrome [Bryobacteraceae bacterium]
MTAISMRRLALTVFAVIPVSAQPPDPELVRGAAVYTRSCAVGYCHGPGGSAGNNAPRLAGRNLPLAQITRVTSEGVPGTAMPGWKASLPEADLRAVIAYVARLSSGAPMPVMPTRPQRVRRPPDVQLGRDLFFDATRAALRCGTCHSVDGWGTAIGPDVAGFKGDIRSVVSKNASTAQIKTGERFPALLVSKTADEVRVYDLGAVLPVLRSFEPGDIEIVAGSTWTHAGAIANYKDEELASILPFLKAAK